MVAHPSSEELAIDKMVASIEDMQSLPYAEMAATIENMTVPHAKMVAAVENIQTLRYAEMTAAIENIQNLRYAEMVAAVDRIQTLPYVEMAAAAGRVQHNLESLYPTIQTASKVLSQYPDLSPIATQIAEASVKTRNSVNTTEPLTRPTTEHPEYPTKPSWLSEITSEIVCGIVNYIFLIQTKNNKGFNLVGRERRQVQLAICCFVMACLHAGGVNPSPVGEMSGFAATLTILNRLFPRNNRQLIQIRPFHQ